MKWISVAHQSGYLDQNGVNNISNVQLESGIHTPNTLIVGALGKDLKRKAYSSYGKDVEL